MGKEQKIEKTNFDKQKNQLKEFSNQTTLNPEFETYKTNDGLFGWFDHAITGNEMNEFVKKLQKYISENNDAIKKLIKEFGEVYETFDTLDNEYIKGILLSIKATEKVSNDNAETIEALKQTVQKLKEIKEENGKYHEYIDSIGEDLKVLNDFHRKVDEYNIQLAESEQRNKKLSSLLTVSIAIAAGSIVMSIIGIILAVVL